MPAVVVPKNQFVPLVSKASAPPQRVNPGPRDRMRSNHACEPAAPYPPNPPTPASAPARSRPPTYSTIVFAGMLRLATRTSAPVAGLKKLASQVLPLPGVRAGRLASSPAATSLTACWRTARRTGSAKNPLVSNE